MWLFTRFGFFSIVRKEGDDHLTIRSRTQGDLLRLCRYYLPKAGDPVAHEGTDYPWRVTCPRNDFAEAMQKIAGDIDYPNFKNEVALSVGKARAARYGTVWSALYGLDEDLPEHAPDLWQGLPWPQKAPSGKALAFGGVVIDPAGRVLLREVAGHYDGYVWSFAKGRADPGESPRAAALREVKEEMGVNARILLPLPSAFLGGTTVTYLFLMLADPRDVDGAFRCKETAGLRWADADAAASLITQSTNPVGRQRDLAILAEAIGSLPPTLHVRPIARREDWKFLPMPAKRTALPYRREFDREEMARIVRGYIAGAQEEKWCAVFEDGELRLHRSWTGLQIFRLRLAPLPERPGHWQVEEAVLNRHPAQYGPADESEALTLLEDLIENLLLRLSDEASVDGMVLALQAAMQPNYLGSPQVVRQLVGDYFDGVLKSLARPASYQELLAANQKLTSAMTDSPDYARMPWHSREQLGQALVHTMNLDPAYCEGESLYFVVSEALASISLAVRRLMKAFQADPKANWEPDGLQQISAVADFVTSVFLGTHTVTHPGLTLDGIEWKPVG